jgi:hypothetical protein
MNRVIASSVVILLGALAGCDGASTNGMLEKCKDVVCATGQTCNVATGVCEGTVNKCANITCSFPQSCEAATGACTNPPVPSTSGTLMDRMGRAGINTVLTNPFDAYIPQGATAAELSDATKDRYNRDGNIKAWPTAWVPAILANLAIFDGLDNTCGNQLLANQSGARYSYLAAALAYDVLYVDTSKTMCTQYLGVELAAARQSATMDCGGRTLAMDVIDTTFNALVAGTPTGSYGDSIAQNATPTATFPFFAAPQ